MNEAKKYSLEVLESKQSYIGVLNEILQECEGIKIQKAEFHSKTIN